MPSRHGRHRRVRSRSAPRQLRPRPDATRTLTLEQGLAEFLTHLGLEKNASDKTVKSYREDLTQALAFARDRLKKDPRRSRRTGPPACCAASSPGCTSRATPNRPIARRLAAVRSFGKFLCRGRACSRKPGAGPSRPAAGQAAAALPDRRGRSEAAGRARRTRTGPGAAIVPSWRRSTRPEFASANWSASTSPTPT